VRLQPRPEPDAQEKQQSYGPDREPIMDGDRLRVRERLSQSMKIAGLGLKAHLKPLATLRYVMFEIE
jgi:hypothetical protein